MKRVVYYMVLSAAGLIALEFSVTAKVNHVSSPVWI